jgi:uncharacterized membrane protein YbaN (DUF454 family)
MKQAVKHTLLITLGWCFVLLAALGIFLPLLPTTPFLILAVGCFAESSPRFHKMLINHRWFGPPLREWEQNKTVHPRTKRRAMLVIVLSFVISISLLMGNLMLQSGLVALCLILLWLVARLEEPEQL